MRTSVARLLLAATLALVQSPAAFAQQCPATLPAQGVAPYGPLPLFPADNWWNTDISSALVDAGSAMNAAPAAVLAGLAPANSTVIGGSTATATVTLSAPAATGGVSVTLDSSKPWLATVPRTSSLPRAPYRRHFR